MLYITVFISDDVIAAISGTAVFYPCRPLSNGMSHTMVGLCMAAPDTPQPTIRILSEGTWTRLACCNPPPVLEWHHGQNPKSRKMKVWYSRVLVYIRPKKGATIHQHTVNISNHTRSNTTSVT